VSQTNRERRTFFALFILRSGAREESLDGRDVDSFVKEIAVSMGRTHLLLVVLGCAANACAQPRGDAREPTCSVQVIVALQSSPDSALVADLGRASGARLELVRAMTSNLHLFSLTAAGPQAECNAAMERLRRDARVRSVDLDQRRQIQ
jgi:hypothetical protein